MNTLDSAFQIDPLFSQMSKTFDEGGARGMLLANLSVGLDSCGVVFDSKEEKNHITSTAPAVVAMVNMKSLINKLADLTKSGDVESLQVSHAAIGEQSNAVERKATRVELKVTRVERKASRASLPRP